MVDHVREHSLIGQPDHGRIRPLKREEIYRVLDRMAEGLPKAGRILLVPPDITRLYSYAGVITSYLYKKLSADALVHPSGHRDPPAHDTGGALAVLWPGYTGPCISHP